MLKRPADPGSASAGRVPGYASIVNGRFDPMPAEGCLQLRREAETAAEAIAGRQAISECEDEGFSGAWLGSGGDGEGSGDECRGKLEKHIPSSRPLPCGFNVPSSVATWLRP